jgi:hypothetical protein
MKVLTRYSKSKNITNIEDVTQTEYLEALAKSQKDHLTAPQDYYNPFSFEQWYTRNVGVIIGQEQQQYESYLKEWYNSRYTPVEVQKNIKADYIEFLKNLTLVFDKEDYSHVLNDINWDDILEVERVIPFYVTKLKEIAIYLINKRDALKKAKIKYNMTGANQALERLFYEYLLKAFTKRNYVLNVPDQAMFSTFPDLSAVNDGFQIQIQELYDNQEYFDKDPTLSASYYFDTTNPDVTAFYESMNISPSAYEWLFKTGFTQLCADNPIFWIVGDVVQSELPLSAFQDTDSALLNEYLKFQLTEKYIGTNQYYVSNGYYVPWTVTMDYDLVKGNNWFYWPSGESLQEQAKFTVDPISLVSSTLIDSGATGYTNYLSADKLFIRYDNMVSGAWLKTVVTKNTTATMSAALEGGAQNSMRFPLPGYGTIGEDIPWTGPQLSNLDLSFNYLPVETQEIIKQSYWTTLTTTSAICAVALNDTSLIENGATAALLYRESDKVRTRPKNDNYINDSNPNGVYQDNIEHAWLYRMEKTDIPLIRGQTYIHWPLYRYDNNNASLNDIVSSQCAPLPLSSVPISALVGSRAGYGLYDSDIIYKLDSRNGTPIECAFLSGATINNLGTDSTFTANATGVIQSSLSLKCKAGEYTTFLWSDPDTYIDDVNIQHVEHQPDCPYLFLDQHSLDKENPADQKINIDYKKWQKCECKAINYSPLGHPGSTYNNYKQKTDFIFMDTLTPIPFSLTTWVDSNGDSYQESEDFAWFQLSGSKVEPDIGWGNGTWVAGATPTAGRRFKFKQGCQYKYYRSSIGHDTTYLVDNTVPYLIIKYPYKNVPTPKWIQAIANETGEWDINYAPSDMVLNAGDYILYDHIDSNWYCLTGIGDLGTTVTQNQTAVNNRSSVWQNFTTVTSGRTVKLIWPSTLYNNGPSVLSFQLTSVVWGVTPPSQSILQYTQTPNNYMEIYADRIGSWTVSVTGNLLAGGKVTYNNVGDFTVYSTVATPTLTGDTIVDTIYADTINMSINTPLYGWNYTTHSYDGTSLGARPFWALASDQDDKITKHKGVDVWGGGIRVLDDYTLITQPESSNMIFDINSYVEYDAKNYFIWTEPLTFITEATSKNWCELVIDPERISPLSGFLYNINQELVVSGTDNISNIILSPEINSYPVLVNYWSNNPFRWTQTLTNVSLGLPPTGGVFVPFVTGDLVEAKYPYANLTNRHYPTIATVPHLGELYNTEDMGGYFVPRMLGASTFLSKNNENILGNDKLLTSENRGMSGVFQDTNTFATDSGLTRTDQIMPITSISVNSNWIKSEITEGYKAGFVDDNISHQEFIPYQTKYETRKTNNIGIKKQNDSYDPWTGETDDVWENNVDWPPSFNKQYNIDKWYAQFTTQKQIWQWKIDIFGNEYALFKTLSAGQTMYDKKQLIGDLWVRNAKNEVQSASSALSAFFAGFSNLTATPLLANEIYNIKNFDLYYDTLMVQTPNWILFNKIDFDYNTGNIDFNVNNIHYINLKENGSDNKFAGTWLFDEDKTVTISVLISSVSGIYPQLRVLDLNTNTMTFIYNQLSMETNQLSTLLLTNIEEPVFTYNKDTLTYNMAFICRNSAYTSFLLGNMYIGDYGDEHRISKVSVITPLK